MSDDDVEYIGTKNAQFPFPDHPFPFNNRPLYAVVLHIEPCNDKPAYGMWFRKSEFNVVNIGRRPGGVTVEKRFEFTMSGRAMFRCPVVSRRHAKIVFSDTQVYLVDLNSHHGTHVLKAGDTVSTMLKPETPTLLANGDVVTFGKTVGRGDHIVDPVVVRIGIVYASPGEDSPPIPFLPDLASSDVLGIKAPEPVKAVSKSSSGHYGVNVPCSLVSDDSSPRSSIDSDIEELDGPPTSSDPVTHNNATDKQLEKAVANSMNRMFSPMSMAPVIHVPSRSQSPLHRLPPINDPYSPSLSPPETCSLFAPLHDCTVSSFMGTDFPPLPSLASDLFKPPPKLPSRSNSISPMDMSSPSPSPSQCNEIESWHLSRSPSPFIVNDHLELTLPDIVVEKTTTQEVNTVPKLTECSSVEGNAPESRQPLQAPDNSLAVFGRSIDPVPAKVRSMLLTLEEKMAGDINSMQSSLASMRGEVAKLQIHRRKYKARFNANVHTIAEKLTDLDVRIADTNALWSSVSEQLDNTAPSDLRAAVELMQARIDSLTVDDASTNRVGTWPVAENVIVSAEELREMITEIKSLRDNAEVEIAADMQAVKAACKSALAQIASQLETPLNPSLKRKRSDDEGEGESASLNVAAGAGGCNATGNQDVAAQSTATSDSIAVAPVVQTRQRRPAKRLRRVASTIMHTATAMTLGAVATWSALAFS